jgi:DNA-binding transcriptional LysR family regulator
MNIKRFKREGAMNFNQLKAFYHTANNRSFISAACELCVSPPTISIYVQALETYYNVPLLKRTKSTI